MARMFKVISGSVHSDKHQKCFNAKDIVSEDDFHRGHADSLVKAGFLAPYNEEEAIAQALTANGQEVPEVDLPPLADESEEETAEEEKATAAPTEQEQELAAQPTPTEDDQPEVKTYTREELDDMGKEDIKDILNAQEIAYKSKDTKADLINLLLGA